MKKKHHKKSKKKKAINSQKKISAGNSSDVQVTTTKKSLSRKQKVTIIILVISLLALAISIGLGFVIAESQVEFDNGLYHITVGTTKAHAYTIDPGIFKGKPYSTFEIYNGERLKIEDNLIWGLEGSSNSDAIQKVSFYYMRKHVITLNVKVASIDKVVATRQDYINIATHPGLNYMQTKSIVLDGQEPLIIFEGNYYGNGYSVSNVNVAKSGLFSQTKYANIYDVNVHIVGNIEGGGNFGGICGKAYSTDIIRCNVSGAITLNAESVNINVGGLVGYYEDNTRKDDNYINNTIFRCKSNVFFDVKIKKSALTLGGIVGISENGFVDISDYNGNIVIEASQMNALDIGGIGGILRKDYSWTEIVSSFDYSALLNVTGDISVEVSDSAIIAQIGGIYGSLSNHIIIDSKYEGKIILDIKSTDAYIGGAFGFANNSKVNSFIMVCTDIVAITTFDITKNDANLIQGDIIGYNKHDSVILLSRK